MKRLRIFEIWVLLVTVGYVGFLRAGDLAEFTFQEAPPRSGTGMRLEPTGPNGLRMAMTSAADFGSEWIFAKFCYEASAQQKLVFRVKGRRENGGAFFHPILVFQDGNRERTITGPRIAAGGEDYHRYVLGLDSDFQLGDGRYTITGLQFSFNSEREPLGKELEVEVDHLRITDADDTVPRRFSTCLASRGGERSPVKSGSFAIFFDFDNNDENTFVARDGRGETPDGVGGFQYRKLLLEHCPEFRLAQTPDEADVLVYQRTTPSEYATQLAELAKKGKPLVMYGEIPDAELRELSPMKLQPLSRDVFPPREKLTQVGERQPIQDISFPRYFDVELASDAEAVLTFAECGVPYLARRGKIYHFAGTSGTTLISSRDHYDEYAVRLWKNLLSSPVRRVSDSFLPKEETSPMEHRTTRGFGRFGWRIGDPMLVDAVSSDLTITNGEAAFRFDPIGTAASGVLRLTGDCSDVRKSFRLEYPESVVKYTTTLLSPHSRWGFERAETVFLTLENIADYAAWQTADGVKIVSLKDKQATETLFDASQDVPWAAPWLLLYREKGAKPLLVVFPHQPKKLAAQVRYGAFAGLEITLHSPSEVVVTGWPWGITKRDFPGWGKELPKEAIQRIDRGVHQSLYFPNDRTEFFTLDEKAKRIRLRTEVQWISFPDDWNTKKEPFVCLPPLTAFLLGAGVMVETPEKLVDFDVPTPFGPMVGKAGETVEWSLPLPDFTDLVPVRIRDEKLNALQNKLFLDGVQWTCGGHVPLERLTPANPSGPNCREPNISYFTWNFGMCTALQGSLLLEGEARKKLERRAAIRTLAPLELYQYKAFARHRQEPFSGLCYPVMFNSYYPNDTPYEPGVGSSVVYGDTNEATVVVAWTGQQLADHFGMGDMIRSNWNFYRYVMRHQLFIDDYCTQAGSCRESGAGAWVDMLDAEYSGMLAYARLAQIAGDEPEYAEAMCRAAKKAVPTVARLYFKTWLERLRPELAGTKYLVTGFGEEGAKVMSFPTTSGNFRAANDLFDFSQGIPGTQYYLYRKYAWQPIQKYLTDIAYPELTSPGVKPRYDYLAALGLYFDDLDKVHAYADAVLAHPENLKAEDWPGIRHPWQIACVMWRDHGQIAITRAENLKIDLAEYDPQTKILHLRGIAGKNPYLEISGRPVPIQEGAFSMSHVPCPSPCKK